MGEGHGPFKDANTIAVEGGEDVTFKPAVVATGSFPLRPPIPGLDSPRCVDSTGLLAQEQVPKRLVILGGGDHRLRVRLDLQPLRLRGDDHRDARHAHPAGGRGCGKELAKQFGKRGIVLQLGKQCTQVEEDGTQLTVHFGDGETVEATSCSSPSAARRSSKASVSRRPASKFDKREGIAVDDHRRTSVPHIYAVGDCAGYWQLAHTAFREGEVAAENACGHEATVDNRAVPRPIYTDPEIACVGLTEAQAREEYGDDVAVGASRGSRTRAL